MQRRITDHSTQFMHMYQFIDRVLKSTQASALVLDKLALLVLLTNRFQYIPRFLAVLVGIDDVSQRQHILYQFIDRVLNGAQAGALVPHEFLPWRTNRFQYIPRVLAVLVGVDDVRQHRRR